MHRMNYKKHRSTVGIFARNVSLCMKNLPNCSNYWYITHLSEYFFLTFKMTNLKEVCVFLCYHSWCPPNITSNLKIDHIKDPSHQIHISKLDLMLDHRGRKLTSYKLMICCHTHLTPLVWVPSISLYQPLEPIRTSLPHK